VQLIALCRNVDIFDELLTIKDLNAMSQPFKIIYQTYSRTILQLVLLLELITQQNVNFILTPIK